MKLGEVCFMDVGSSSISNIPALSTYPSGLIKEPDDLSTRIFRVVARVFTEISRNLGLESQIRRLSSKHIFSDPLQEIDYKYTRKGVDASKFGTGGSNSRAQYHVLDRMTKNIDLSNQTEQVRSKVLSFRNCFERSEKFFNEAAEMLTPLLLHPIVTISSFATSLKNEFILLKEGESFIFPAGTEDHAVVYKATKMENGKLYLRLYNTGGGAEEYVDENFNTRVCMPLFEIDPRDTDIHTVFSKILELKRLPLKELHNSEYNNEIEKIITQTLNPGGIRVNEGDKKNLHNPQDRGNCSWKSLSTCFSDLVEGIQIVPDETTLKKLPQAVANDLVGKEIGYKRLVKIVDYELIRARIDKINQAGIHCIKDRIKEVSFSKRQEKKLEVKNFLNKFQKEFQNIKSLLIEYRIKGIPKDFEFPQELKSLLGEPSKLENLKKYIELTTENKAVQSCIIRDLDSLVYIYHNKDVCSEFIKELISSEKDPNYQFSLSSTQLMRNPDSKKYLKSLIVLFKFESDDDKNERIQTKLIEVLNKN